MYCRNCGNEMPEGSKFCGKCGKQLRYENISLKDENSKVKRQYESQIITDNVEKYKKIVKVSLLTAIISFVIVIITANMSSDFTINFIWNLSKIVFFISSLVYGIGIIACTVSARKNHVRLRGWISVAQTLTMVMVIVAIFIGGVGFVVNLSDNKQMKQNANATSNQQSQSSSHSNNNYGSIDFNNPSNIKNGEIAFRKYADDLGIVVIKNINVKYLETDGKGKYAFQGTVAVSFNSMSSYSQTETWYIVVDFVNNTYEGSNSLESAKFASGWNN